MSGHKKPMFEKNNSQKLNKPSSSLSRPAPSPMAIAAPFLGELPRRPIPVTRRIARITTHGFRCNETNCGHIGAVFQDDLDDWQFGFIGNIFGISKLESELQAIYNSLYLAFDNSWEHIELQTSCNEAIQIFEFRKEGPPSMRNEIHTGHTLLHQLHITFDYIHIVENNIATKLAKMGAEQSSLCKIIYEAPEIIQDCITDNKLEACTRYISASDTD